jgi:hypothetical protein
MLNRAEAHVLRLSVLHAILDRSRVITLAHHRAALGFVQYCEASVASIFGDALGDPLADRILEALRRRGPMERAEITRVLLGRNVAATRITRALQVLLEAGKVTVETRAGTGGRSAEVWRAIPGTT